MRIILALLAVTLGACAASPQPAPPTRQVRIDNSNVEDVQRAGYKIVNKDGVTLYCRTDALTGSRIQTHTMCLTERELQEQNEAVRQSMESISSRQPGPYGH